MEEEIRKKEKKSFKQGDWVKVTREPRKDDPYWGDNWIGDMNYLIGFNYKVFSDSSNSGYTVIITETGVKWRLPTFVLEKVNISKPEEKKDELVLGKFKIGDIVVSLTKAGGWRNEGELFKVLDKSNSKRLYYRESNISSSDIPSWRLATDIEKRLWDLKGNEVNISSLGILTIQVHGYLSKINFIGYKFKDKYFKNRCINYEDYEYLIVSKVGIGWINKGVKSKPYGLVLSFSDYLYLYDLDKEFEEFCTEAGEIKNNNIKLENMIPGEIYYVETGFEWIMRFKEISKTHLIGYSSTGWGGSVNSNWLSYENPVDKHKAVKLATKEQRNKLVKFEESQEYYYNGVDLDVALNRALKDYVDKSYVDTQTHGLLPKPEETILVDKAKYFKETDDEEEIKLSAPIIKDNILSKYFNEEKNEDF